MGEMEVLCMGSSVGWEVFFLLEEEVSALGSGRIWLGLRILCFLYGGCDLFFFLFCGDGIRVLGFLYPFLEWH